MGNKIEYSKQIKDFEDYLIFSSGKVFSLKSNKYLKPCIDSSGYYYIVLRNNKKHYNKSIARLTAQAFIPNLDNKPQINHKDGNKINNDVLNLEWMTHAENIQHAYNIGLISNAGRPKIPVNVYKEDKFLSTHLSLTDAARIYGMHRQSISNILAGKYNHIGGLTFSKIF